MRGTGRKRWFLYMIVGGLVLIPLCIYALVHVRNFTRFSSSLPAPTPNSTSETLQSSERILAQYENEVQPLVEELQSQKEWYCDPHPLSEEDMYVTLVPFDKRLYYPQEALFPNLAFGKPEASTHLYIAYDYARGVDLSTVYDGAHWIRYEVADFSDNMPDTQEIFLDVYLFVRTEERLCVLERHFGSAGYGLTVRYDTRHRDLVEEVLPSFQHLKSYQMAIANTLKGVLCYATGIDYYPSLPLSRRLTLIEWAMQSPYWSDREQAASTLALKGVDATDSATMLVQVVQADESAMVRYSAIRALGQIGSLSDEAVRVLTDAVWYDHRAIAISALDGLGKRGGQGLPIFVEVLSEHPDGYVRSAAASQIAQLGARAGAAKLTLITALESETNDFARVEIVKALGSLGPIASDALPMLVQLLHTDNNPNVRSAAARALSNIDVEGSIAIPELIKALGDERGAAWSAVHALGNYGDRAEDAIPALIQILEQNSENSLDRVVARALTAITGQDLGVDSTAWQEWWQAQP